MSAKILLVDDELNCFVGQELLSSLGMQTSLAASGAEALDQLQQKVFDLIFMDVSMPVMDGYELTQLIRAQNQYATIPIVALTAHAFADDRAVCLAAVMNNYLAKPFTLDELKKIIYKWTSTARLA